MKRIFILILAIGLVLGAASYSVACGGQCYYDCPFYSKTYTGTPDTDWIPGTDAGVSEPAVLAAKILTP